MNESARHAVDGVKVLWPYLSFIERTEWVARLRCHFDNDFVRTVEVLSGESDGY